MEPGIIGFGDEFGCNPNYSNELISIFVEGEILEKIYFSENEYGNNIVFSSKLTENNFKESDIIQTKETNFVGSYKHKKIFFNKKEIEVSFIVNEKGEVEFIAYYYDDITSNVLYPKQEGTVIIDKEREIISYIEHLYS